MKKIIIGCDHGGFELKQKVIEYLKTKEYDIEDMGCFSKESTDHPIFAEKVAKQVVSTEASNGILICGSGLGMCIAANKIMGATCILANSIELARLGKEHNGANILAIGERTHFIDDALEIVDTFLNTPVNMGENYVRRRKIIDEMM